MRVVYRVAVEGEDITSSLAPRLHSLTLSDKEGSASDSLEITLDDRGGEIVLPPDGVEISVFFGWDTDGKPPLRFVGTVDKPTSNGGRGEGMSLSISAKGINAKGKEKEEDLRSWDDATFETVIQDAAKDAGFGSVRIDPDLAKVERPYWFQGNESFVAFGQRLSRELGGTFKIQGQAVTISKRGSNQAATGKALPTIRAERGRNLHSWSISPTRGRPRYKTVRGRVYDREEARYKDVEVEVDGEDVETVKTLRDPLASEAEAKTRLEADAAESGRERGGGSIVIEGNGDASPEGLVELVGARPGIDGTYTITDVSHEIGRGGWTTTLTLKKPGGEAGKDKRSGKRKSAAADSSSSSSGSSDELKPINTDARLKPKSSDRLGFAPSSQV